MMRRISQWMLGAGGLALLAALFAVAYAGLAALGFGGWRLLLADPARVAVCAALIVLAAATPLCGCNLSMGSQSDSANNWIFPCLLLLGLAMGWSSAWCDRHGYLTLGGSATRYLGLALFLLGAFFRLAAMITLGARFTVWVAIQDDHELVTRGLYRFIRHPSYTGAILTLLGWAMTFRSLVGISLAVVMSLILLTRITAEETFLVAKFGQRYQSYQSRSWRLAPWVY